MKRILFFGMTFIYSSIILSNVTDQIKFGLANLSSTIKPDYQFQHLGRENLPSEEEIVARDIIAKIGLNKEIPVKIMSPFAEKMIGKNNAFSTYNAIYISRNLISSRLLFKFAIAHEAAHIKHNHLKIAHILRAGIGFLQYNFSRLIYQGTNNLLASALLFLAGHFCCAVPFHRTVDRMQEHEADATALKHIDIDINELRKQLREIENKESSFNLLSTHPSVEHRFN